MVGMVWLMWFAWWQGAGSKRATEFEGKSVHPKKNEAVFAAKEPPRLPQQHSLLGPARGRQNKAI